MKNFFIVFLLINTVFITRVAMDRKKQLDACYSSGEIVFSDGKIFHCVWKNSDSWSEETYGVSKN